MRQASSESDTRPCIVPLPPADMRDALRRFEPALAFAQAAEDRKSRERVGEPLADLLKQALLLAVQTRACEHWCKPNRYGRSPFGWTAIAICDRTAKRGCPAGIFGRSQDRAARTGGRARRREYRGIVTVTGRSACRANAPGNCGRVRSMTARHEGASGSHG